MVGFSQGERLRTESFSAARELRRNFRILCSESLWQSAKLEKCVDALVRFSKPLHI